MAREPPRNFPPATAIGAIEIHGRTTGRIVRFVRDAAETVVENA